jgi:hypothetical protein
VSRAGSCALSQSSYPEYAFRSPELSGRISSNATTRLLPYAVISLAWCEKCKRNRARAILRRLVRFALHKTQAACRSERQTTLQEQAILAKSGKAPANRWLDETPRTFPAYDKL